MYSAPDTAAHEYGTGREGITGMWYLFPLTPWHCCLLCDLHWCQLSTLSLSLSLIGLLPNSAAKLCYFQWQRKFARQPDISMNPSPPSPISLPPPPPPPPPHSPGSFTIHTWPHSVSQFLMPKDGIEFPAGALIGWTFLALVACWCFSIVENLMVYVMSVLPLLCRKCFLG